MSSCVTELDGYLQSMMEQKPPGVSGPKIAAITSLCTANVQSETVLIQKVYTHFKKAPANKKLGVLYVVDSVSRQWLDHARKAGQALGPAAADGTFAAGVNHVTELLPSFMSDIINTAPEDQKAKIKKLIDIWERGSTFPAAMLSSFKERLNAAVPNGQTTTPKGTPPKDFISLNQAGLQAPPAQDTSSILANLQALANLANQNKSGSTAPGSTTQGSSSNVTYPQNAFAQNLPPSVNAAASLPPALQAVNVPGALNGVFSYPGMSNLAQSFMPNLSNGQLPVAQPVAQSMMPQTSNVTVAPETLQRQLQILQALKQQNIPEDQWPSLLAIIMSTSGGAAPPVNVQPQPAFSDREDSSRDRNGFEYMRSPGRYRNGRSRSRSPSNWDRRRDSSPNNRRRDSPVYGDYAGDRNGRGDQGRRGGAARGRGNGIRQRSPDRFRRSPSPHPDPSLPAPGAKWIEYDSSIGEGMIKVLSRTLFVGGVTSSEAALREIFAQFGRVQTCIVNIEKRHAFVKMITREEAQRAKDGMEHYKSADMQLRTRWGVGFGPRDCSDYQTGVSIIPIERLTDADRKWMLTADFGGSGGKPIETGLCVEEPDIEIGAGVSSKAISRRMQTDRGGQQGPRSTRDPPPTAGASRFRQPDRKEERDGAAINVPPAVPGFGFQFPLMTNPMSMFPPGFVMPGQTPAQPPPPGAG